MRLHGLEPRDYTLDQNSKTLSGEILGQGVIVSFFEKIIRKTRDLIPLQPGSTRKASNSSFDKMDTNSADSSQLCLALA